MALIKRPRLVWPEKNWQLVVMALLIGEPHQFPLLHNKNSFSEVLNYDPPYAPVAFKRDEKDVTGSDSISSCPVIGMTL